jgi:hypothetical protein
MLVLYTPEFSAFNVGLSLGRGNGALFSSDVYGTISFGDLENGEMVEGGGIFDIAGLCIETG